MSEHFDTYCREHEVRIGGCRCSAPEKVKRYADCPEGCPGRAVDTVEMVDCTSYDVTGTEPDEPEVVDCTACGVRLVFVSRTKGPWIGPGSTPASLQCVNPDCARSWRLTEPTGMHVYIVGEHGWAGQTGKVVKWRDTEEGDRHPLVMLVDNVGVQTVPLENLKRCRRRRRP